MDEPRRTKRCVYCGEEILADAVKCRWCKEFLDEGEDLPVSHHAVSRRGEKREAERPLRPFSPPRPAASAALAGVTMRFVPSLWAMTGVLLSALILLAVAIVLMAVPLDQYLGEKIMAQKGMDIAVEAVHLIGFVMAAVAVMRVVYKLLKLKSTRYDLSADRIEWTRGIFSRKVDNIDMFRVVDIKLHRTLLDCLLGIGSVTLITKDETDPVFTFEKLRNPRLVYDMVKTSSLEADRRQGVVHIE